MVKVTKSGSIFKSRSKNQENDQIVKPEHVIVSLDSGEVATSRNYLGDTTRNHMLKQSRQLIEMSEEKLN